MLDKVYYFIPVEYSHVSSHPVIRGMMCAQFKLLFSMENFKQQSTLPHGIELPVSVNSIQPYTDRVLINLDNLLP